MQNRKNLRALSRIHAAIQDVTGYGYNAGQDAGGGAGGGNADAAKGADDAKKDAADKGGDADKVTLTKAELQQQIKAALAEQERKAQDKAKKEQDERDAEEARKRGEWETVANDEKAKREAAEAERDTERRDRKIDKALIRAASKQEGGYPFEVFEEYVLPKLLTAIAPDATDNAIEKATTEAVEKYVKDNPRVAKGGTGLPPAPRTANRVNGGGTTNIPRTPRQPSVAASRF